MAINHSHQHVSYNGLSRRIRSNSLGILIGSLAWAAIVGSAWASDSIASTAALQDTDTTPITLSESAVSPNATWQIEIAYAVSETSSGISQE